MDQSLSLLVGQLYDAALDPDLWSVVLRQLDAYFQTAQSWLAIEDAADTSASYFYASVPAPEWIGRYVETYMLINPTRLAMTYRVKAGDTIITTDFMTPAEYKATRFSREFLADARIADIAVGILEQTSTRITVLSAQRNFEQGFADETLRSKLELVTPHAQRAVKIARLFEHQKMVASTLAETLDKLVAASFCSRRPVPSSTPTNGRPRCSPRPMSRKPRAASWRCPTGPPLRRWITPSSLRPGAMRRSGPRGARSR